MNIIEAMTDTKLFGAEFGAECWHAWRVLLAGFYGLPMDDNDATLFASLTGGRKPPTTPCSEFWQVVGRRGGKSRIAALIGVYESFFRDHSPRLAPGERATCAILAKDRRQARTVYRYIQGLIRSNPMLEGMVVKENAEALELSNGGVLEVATASYRAARGYTYSTVICDEIAHWHSEGVNPDREIIQAVRPGLSTLGGRLICLSSPYARRGALWTAYQRHFGKDSPVLVAQAGSQVMNPGLDPRIITEALADDRASASAEYLAEFRSDLEAYVDIEQLSRLCRTEPLTIPPMYGQRYRAFTDPSGGGADGFTLAIGHRDHNRLVVDLLTERTRVSPAAVVEEYALILRQYGIVNVTGDKYAGGWVQDEFRRQGITYQFSALNKTEIYSTALSAISSGQTEFPPMEKLIRQFQGLERRTTSTGRDIIDHAHSLHDDLANAACGLIAMENRAGGVQRVRLGGI